MRRSLGALVGATLLAAPAAAIDGKAVYTAQCQACHQANGIGTPNLAPPLVSPVVVNAAARRKEYLARVVLQGMTGPIQMPDGSQLVGIMPPQPTLPDAEIAAALNHVLRLNRKPAAFKPEDIRALRAASISNEELKKQRAELLK